MPRPIKGDYAPYYETYIGRVEGEDIISILEEQYSSTSEFLFSITDDKAGFAYDKGKWTVREVIGHILDTERVFAYRAFCIARGEKQSLPGFEQDDYVKLSGSNDRTLASLIKEYRLMRENNLFLFKTFKDEVMNNRGTASGNPVTVLAILWIIAGHELHHINILKTKYLSGK